MATKGELVSLYIVLMLKKEVKNIIIYYRSVVARFAFMVLRATEFDTHERSLREKKQAAESRASAHACAGRRRANMAIKGESRHRRAFMRADP